MPTLRHRVSALFNTVNEKLGEKGSGVPGYGKGNTYLGVKGKTGKQREAEHKQENPVARLKLLLVSFFVFEVLLITH